MRFLHHEYRSLPSPIAAGTAASSLLLALAGCASPQIADYAAEKPLLDLREYFTLARSRRNGVFRDPQWFGQTPLRGGNGLPAGMATMGCLDEQFVYSDGERQRRVWRLKHRAMVAIADAPTMWSAADGSSRQCLPLAVHPAPAS